MTNREVQIGDEVRWTSLNGDRSGEVFALDDTAWPDNKEKILGYYGPIRVKDLLGWRWWFQRKDLVWHGNHWRVPRYA